MSMIPIHRPGFMRISSCGKRNHKKNQNFAASWTMTMNSHPSQTRKKEELLSLEPQKISIPHSKTTVSNLRFNRLQPPDQELIQDDDRIEFGQFVAREALLDEEYWHRYVENYKRKFAEQEFNALKRRCKRPQKHKCTCIITVKKEERNVKTTVLKSVVGTLDLSIRYLLPGETFPGERVKFPLFCSIDRTGQSRYGYIANLCVAKSARRQGIASNMLHFAVNLAKSNGIEEVFVRVYRNNKPAQKLYEKMGFKVVEMATRQLSKEQTYLLCYKINSHST
ncbi:N-acetyltransferase san [Actinidia chinensis var. chinensis]|uniref:N-acetyltransferase san n=1 Tax=Actinidia chinensis var. chinensis TaxID=1590841 RepID=A0A2R6R445_ACTCC|nr:N-acetyltransferase san [Actinidia chinensis var. chinensis]